MMRLHSKWLGVLPAIVGGLLLGACAQYQVASRDVATSSGDGPIFVLGIAPDDVGVTIVQVDVNGDGFSRRVARLPVIARQVAERGFVVAHGPGGETLAIDSYELLSLPRNHPREFNTCGKKTPVFALPQTGVVYVGSVRLVGDRYELAPSYYSDFERAKAYVDANYPALRGMLTPVTFTLMRKTTPCQFG